MKAQPQSIIDKIIDQIKRSNILTLKPDYKSSAAFDNHKVVIKIEDKPSGLRGFIAIHNDNLGTPAVGGTRMFPYASEKDALNDVLNLSRAMTYKCAVAQVPHGGAKAVIIGDPKKDKSKDLLKAYAEKIKSLNGAFCTGEDVGITQEDVNIMLETSSYFIGKPNLAGDPSPYASLSAFYAIETAVPIVLRKSSLNGVKVAIKGVGKTGGGLVQLLAHTGAKIYISDIDKEATKKIKNEFPDVEIVNNNEIISLDVDIYSPCAMGNEFSIENASQIKAKIICGTANNQLSDNKIGDWLFKNGVIYIPDYVANSGGLINVVDELEKGGYKRARVLSRVNKVKKIVKEILEISIKNNESPHRVSDKIAESYFQKR